MLAVARRRDCCCVPDHLRLFLFSRTWCTRCSRMTGCPGPTANKAERNSGRDSLSRDWEFRANTRANNRSLVRALHVHVPLNKTREVTKRRPVVVSFAKASRSVSVTTDDNAQAISRRTYTRRENGGFAISPHEAIAYPCIILRNGRAKDKQRMKMMFTHRS